MTRHHGDMTDSTPDTDHLTGDDVVPGALVYQIVDIQAGDHHG